MTASGPAGAPKARFDRAVLVFKPGKPGMTARINELQRELAAGAPDLQVDVLPTDFAEHARDLARSVAATGSPLIVSVSGDGGYNEAGERASSSNFCPWRARSLT
jgi:diacylglycerol kinase (ATP)